MSKLVILRTLRPIVHILLILFTFYVGYVLRLETDLIPGIQIRIPVINPQELFIYALASAGIFLFFGIVREWYPLFVEEKPKQLRFYKIRTYRIVTSTFIAYFGRGNIFLGGISRLIIVWSAVFVLIAIPLFEKFRHIWYNRVHTNKQPQTLFVYNKQSDIDHVLEYTTLSREYITTISIDEFIVDRAKNFQTIILIGTIPTTDIETLVDTIRGSRIQLYHIADSLFLNDIVYEAATIHGMFAFAYKTSRLDEWASVTKRVFDIFVGFCALVCFSPVFLCIACAIKINSRGPVFYIQQRVGTAGKLFTFIKFRTMYTELCVGDTYGGTKAMEYRQKLMASDANIRKGELQKIENDPRVTRVGKFLRATSLDELPNLFSVIVGTMSLIGPRPHLPSEVARYKPRHKRLLTIKPGITGYAQIHGRDTLTFDDEAHYDLYYIQHRSLRLDLYIIFSTIKVLSGGKGK